MYSSTPQHAPPPPATHDVTLTIARVAALSVIAGLVFEALSLAVVLWFQQDAAVLPVIAELAQRVSWSVIVCVGLALGTAASRLRAPALGIAGAFAAPIAFNVARVLHKVISEALGLTLHAGGPPVLLVGALKGAEYACLGLLLGFVGRRSWGGAAAHLFVGAVVGVLFGGAIVVLFATSGSQPPPVAPTISRAINEMLFPVACSLVLYAGEALGRRAIELSRR